MKTFKSPHDLGKLPENHPAFPTIKELVRLLIEDYTGDGYTYDPDDDGFIILIEEGDVYRELDELWDGCTLLNIYWEGITLRDGFFTAIYLANNQYGLAVVIPDAPWVNGKLRKVIEYNLDP